MPQLGNAPELEAIAGEMSAMELLCNEIELSLRERNWERFGVALADSRRTMHAFTNAMAAATGVRNDDFDREIYARLARVYSVREEQMGRLRSIHEDIGERLKAIGRWKVYARAVGENEGGNRPVKLLDDVR